MLILTDSPLHICQLLYSTSTDAAERERRLTSSLDNKIKFSSWLGLWYPAATNKTYFYGERLKVRSLFLRSCSLELNYSFSRLKLLRISLTLLRSPPISMARPLYSCCCISLDFWSRFDYEMNESSGSGCFWLLWCIMLREVWSCWFVGVVDCPPLTGIISSSTLLSSFESIAGEREFRGDLDLKFW